jgi:vitamin K-dependent gamma-carboxylase
MDTHLKAASSPFKRLERALLSPVDAAWLVALRVLFGLALCASMLRFSLYGWVERLFVAPSFRFSYYGFAWLEPLPGPLMHGLFWALAVLSLAVAAGFCFRFAALGVALGLSYFQLLDVSTYLNHYYLAALLAWLLALSPAGRVGSVDAWLARMPWPATVPASWLYLLRVQVGVVYAFAGLAKAQSDWLLHAQPLRIWLGASTDLPLIGPLLTIEWVPLAMSWAGFLFDTTIVGFLLMRRTRPYAYAVVIVFHLFTRLLFPIGMFPVFMVLAALMFFGPSWPRALWARLRQIPLAAVRGLTPTSVVMPTPAVMPHAALRATGVQRAGLALAAAYCVLQVALPLRAHLYGGNVLWHEQGMRFSWRVMLRAKGGSTELLVRDTRSGRVLHVSPRQYLTDMQESEMSGQPDLIVQLARHVKQDFERRGVGPVEVRALTRVALNGRRAAPLVDPEIDLATVEDGLARASWILPAPNTPPPHTRPVL